MNADHDALCVDADGNHLIDDEAGMRRLLAAIDDPNNPYEVEGRREIRKRRILAGVGILAALAAVTLRGKTFTRLSHQRRGGVSVPSTGEGPPTAPLVGGW